MTTTATATPDLQHLALGAVPTAAGVRFAVWAPAAERVELQLEAPDQARHRMVRDAHGVWAIDIPRAAPGWRYRYRVDGGDPFPDPYSRSQPQGVHGPSEVFGTADFTWHDQAWPGLGIRGLTIYQCHVGTATPEGTLDSLIGQLPRLAELGVAAIQLLPLAEFPGARNWGYDGVDLFAVESAYGGPPALQRFVDAAHAHGLGVILDVVYNHLGPDGNYLRAYSPLYFTDRHKTPWGDALNYDGEGSEFVRKLVTDNARYWIQAFHADGLRLDATHAILDDSPRHILADLTTAAREAAGDDRSVVLIAETHENDTRYLDPVSAGGHGFDAVWADDFHHAMRRYLAGDSTSYYADFEGTLDEVARALRDGWLYQGQVSKSRGKPRGTPPGDHPAWQFQWMLQNHDQVGNRALGDRLHHKIDADRFRAASAVLLLAPYTPLIFMGQEFLASTPFQYFTSHEPELGKLVREGRRKEFAAFPEFAGHADRVPDPQDEQTFLRSRLPLDEATHGAGSACVRLYHALLRLRRDDLVVAAQDRFSLQAGAVGANGLQILWRDQRCLLVNFGDDALVFRPTGETRPLSLVLSTNQQEFGGNGEVVDVTSGEVRVPARTAAFLSVGDA